VTHAGVRLRLNIAARIWPTAKHPMTELFGAGKGASAASSESLPYVALLGNPGVGEGDSAASSESLPYFALLGNPGVGESDSAVSSESLPYFALLGNPGDGE